MRVLLVAEPMLGLDADRVGELVRAGWLAAAPGAVLDVVPVPAVPGESRPVLTLDPWGRSVPASFATAAATAWLDTQAAAGPAHRRPDDDPTRASSAGIGDLVLAALEAGARTVVVPLDDLACHDGGAGLVGVLAGRSDATVTDLTGDDVRAARERLAGVDLVGRYADDVPLLGLGGASATQAQEKGMSAQTSQDVENAMGLLVDRMRREVPEPTDLLSGAPLRRDKAPGAGAGGGLGHGILLAGGRLEPMAPALVRDLDLRERLADADLVVTSTGRFDWRVLRSSIVGELAGAAGTTPVVLLAGESEVGRREAMNLGLAGVYDVVEDRRHRARVLADPVAALRARVERVARTWTPR